MEAKQNADAILSPTPKCSNVRIRSKKDSLLGATSPQRLRNYLRMKMRGIIT